MVKDKGEEFKDLSFYKEYRVYVYTDKIQSGVAISRVRYNTVLDYWNGKVLSNGGKYMHKGLAKLKDGNYALIIGCDKVSHRDYAYVITEKQAVEEIAKAHKTELFKTKKFKVLKPIYDEMIEKGLLDDNSK